MHVAAVSRPAISTPALRLAWLLGVAATWWVVGASRIDEALPAAGDPAIRTTLPLALAGLRLAGAMFETFFYWAWWRSSGLSFSFACALPWFATLSLTEAWAGTLRSFAIEIDGPWVSGIAVLAGAGVRLEPGDIPVPGLVVAFGDLGLLTLGRLVGAAAIQAREIGRGLRGPLALTAVVWLITRLIAWWSYDLMRGMSPT